MAGQGSVKTGGRCYKGKRDRGAWRRDHSASSEKTWVPGRPLSLSDSMALGHLASQGPQDNDGAEKLYTSY